MHVAKALRRPDELYERDFHRWLLEQAAHARAGRLEALDLKNIAEELEGLARADRREIRNRMSRLLEHLLKFAHLPDSEPRRGWIATVGEQRRRIAAVIEDSPSLRTYPGEVIEAAYARAVESLEDQGSLSPDALPAKCPFTVEQVLDRRFVP
jgi:hypothetical protein